MEKRGRENGPSGMRKVGKFWIGWKLPRGYARKLSLSGGAFSLVLNKNCK